MTYTEATTSQSRDCRRAESRCRYGVCTTLPLASQTEQRCPKWSLGVLAKLILTFSLCPAPYADSRSPRIEGPPNAMRKMVTLVARVEGVLQQPFYILVSAIWPSFSSISSTMRFGRFVHRPPISRLLSVVWVVWRQCFVMRAPVIQILHAPSSFA